jgi:L-asparaginase
MARPRILILYTGGTFGMDAASLTVPKLSPSALKKRLLGRVPELSALADCTVEVLMNRDSAHVGSPEWLGIADRIRSRWNRFDGVVLLHGTDTLAYTASALSFLLRPCLKPVVLTGAQRPLAALRSDARRNLISAVEIATMGAGRSGRRLSQVSVFFNDLLFQGNRVRKRSAVDFSGFESPKAPTLARVGAQMHVDARAFKKTSGRPRLKDAFSNRVAMLQLTPGLPARALREKLLPELEGLVLVAFPSGTAPTHDPEFLALLAEARSLDIPIVVATEGVGVTGSEYRAGKEMLDLGCLWSGAMTPECAYVKAAWILGNVGKGPGVRTQFKKLWQKEVAFEGVSQR